MKLYYDPKYDEYIIVEHSMWTNYWYRYEGGEYDMQYKNLATWSYYESSPPDKKLIYICEL